MGREQLKRLPGLVHERRQLAARYDELLAARTFLAPPRQPHWASSNWQSYCVRLPGGVEQRSVMQSMLDAGISTRRGIMCSHLEPAYANGELRFPLDHSEAAQRTCLLLPLFPGMQRESQDRVVEALAGACASQGAAAEAA